MPRNSLIQFRKDIGTPASGVLVEGEPGWRTDVNRLYVGDAAGNPIPVAGFGSVINIVDHGGVGDGATANAAAFISAQAESMATGLPIYFPPGTFNIASSSIAAGQTLKFVGEGKGLSSVVWTGGIGVTIVELDLKNLTWTSVGLTVTNSRLRSCSINITFTRIYACIGTFKAEDCDFSCLLAFGDSTQTVQDASVSLVNCRLIDFQELHAIVVRPPNINGNTYKVEISNCNFGPNYLGAAPEAIVHLYGAGLANVNGYTRIRLNSCVFENGVLRNYINISGSTSTNSIMTVSLDFDVFIDSPTTPTIRYQTSGNPNINIEHMSVRSNVAVDPTPIAAQLAASTGVFEGSDGIWWNGTQLTP